MLEEGPDPGRAWPTSPTVTRCSTVTSPVAASTDTSTPTPPISQNGGRIAVAPARRITPTPTTSPPSAPNHCRITSEGVRADTPCGSEPESLPPADATGTWIRPSRTSTCSTEMPADSAARPRRLSHTSVQAAWTARPTMVVVRLAPVVHSNGVVPASLATQFPERVMIYSQNVLQPFLKTRYNLFPERVMTNSQNALQPIPRMRLFDLREPRFGS